MLRQRFVTASLAVIVVIAVMVWGVVPWRVLVLLGTLLSAGEFVTMQGMRWWSVVSFFALADVVWWEWFPQIYPQAVLWVLVVITLLVPVFTKNRVTVNQSSTLVVGSLYIGYGGYGLASIRALPHGLVLLFFVLFCIWMTDTAAFFIGTRVGGVKLWPSISPNKTVSGAVAGIAGAVVVALLFAWFTVLPFGFLTSAIVGAAISIAGQLGDLVESAYKRSSGVKDSGRMFPGHGGILDRVDSLLFAAPLAYLVFIHGLAAWMH